jgi:hypothetical protein
MYSDTLRYALFNGVLRLTQAAGRHWDRHSVYGDHILKSSPMKFQARLVAQTSVTPSATEHFGTLMLLAVTIGSFTVTIS